MSKLQNIILVGVLLIQFNGAVSAAERSGSFASIQLENDAFSLSNNRDDGYYTHGTLISILREEEPPEWLKSSVKWSPFKLKSSDVDHVQYTLGHKIFTPNDTHAAIVVPNDRPYAGYLYFGVSALSHTHQSESTDYGNMVELNFGLIGPAALGEQAQTFIHHMLGFSRPNGWDNQLSNELTVAINYSRLSRRIVPMGSGLMVGINRNDTIALGNVYTYLSSGLMFRIGNNLKSDLSPPTISPGFPGIPYFRSINEHGWYLYGGLEGRLVFRDIFLDGNTFVSSHRVDKELLVGDVQLGFVYMFGDIRFAFSKLFRTHEFKTQTASESYGAINLSFRY